METMKKSINQSHWNNTYRHIKYMVAPNEDPTITLINRYVPNADSKQECFEIGCTPCPYLANVGIKKKYIVNGIDYSDALNERLLKWLSSLNLTIGVVKQDNFFSICKGKVKQYDFVYSLGFIEHFREYKKVVCLHDLFVKKGGYLVISTPNYSGKIIYMLHRFFNYKNLKIHYLPSMNPKEWSEILEKKGYEILFCGYFGGFHYNHYNDSLGIIKNTIWTVISPILKFAQKHIKREHIIYSRYCGIVARKI